MSDLQQRFHAALAALKPGPKLVVGVSGGLDSMALLHMLQASERKLIVAHFNHQLRGAESDGDETFVREYAAKNGLEFRAGRGDVRAEAKGISIEMAARKLRHAFLAQVARQAGADIVLAHHADDQIETVIMRNMRNVIGYGSAGMRACATSPADPGIRVLRPLLVFRKRELRQFAEPREIVFREDSSNGLLDADRNRVRHEILPLWRAAGDKEEKLLAMLPALQQEEDQARELARNWKGGDFSNLRPRFQRDIVAFQLERAGTPVTAGRISTLLNNISKAVMIRHGVMVTLSADGVLQFHHDRIPDAPIWIDFRAMVHCVVHFSGGVIEWEFPWPIDELNPANGWMLFDPDKVGNRVLLRHPLPGDRVRLSGRSSARPLMDVLSRNKIPRVQRPDLVVAATENGEIFWVEGLRITENFKINETTYSALAWRFRRD